MRRSRRRGVALLIAIAVGVLLTATAWGGLAVLATEATVSLEQEREDEARELAEAGVQWTIARLEKDRAFAGERDHAFAAGKFDVAVEAIAGRPDARRVRVVGRVPGPHGTWVKAAWVAVIERAAGPVWRRMSWRVGTSTR